MTRNKYKTGLVIGRFQPFHHGHKFLIEKALEICDKIYIGIGSSNKTDEKNPYPADKRIEFIQKFIDEEKLEKRVSKILKLYDNPDDDVWFENLFKETGPFDVTIGNNPWNNGIIERHGIIAVTVGFYKRHRLEGIKIRKLMEEEKNWEDRVPEYLVSLIKNNV
jgi:nicotinamide-nucleotide adenylyltransferase